MAKFENIDLGLFLGAEFDWTDVFEFLAVAVVFQNSEFGIEWSRRFYSVLATYVLASALVDVVTEHDSFWWRGVGEWSAVKDELGF